MKDNHGSLFERMAPKLEALIKSNAVVGRTVSVGGRHVVPLVELSLSLGGGAGSGEGDDPSSGTHGAGHGGAAGGGAKATPVAVLVIDGNNVRVSALGH